MGQKAIWRGLIGTLTLIPHESSFRVHEIEGLYSFHALRRMIVEIGFACGMVKYFRGPFVKQQGFVNLWGIKAPQTPARVASRPAPHPNFTQQSRVVISDRESSVIVATN